MFLINRRICKGLISSQASYLHFVSHNIFTALTASTSCWTVFSHVFRGRKRTRSNDPRVSEGSRGERSFGAGASAMVLGPAAQETNSLFDDVMRSC